MDFPPPPGTELCQLIGSGSIFWVALVREAGKLCACKRLIPRVRDEPAGRVAMVREAKLLSVAKHPALPELRRVGTDKSGPFILETYVEGASLREIVEAWDRRGRRVPPRLVAHIAALASAALAELHELEDPGGPLEIVHGDITPEHIRINSFGDLGFVDLGAARFRDLEPKLDAGDKGTLPYVAPEVARGEARPNQSGDVYALAAALLYLATGEPIAHAREEAALLFEIGERGLRRELLPRAIGLDERGRTALHDALSPEPTTRLASARELADALR